MIHVILLAGGSGTRMKADRNKVLLQLNGKSILRRSAEAFTGLCHRMTVVCRREDRRLIETELEGLPFPLLFAEGGDTRQASVLNGLHVLCTQTNTAASVSETSPASNEEDMVLVHDGARCLVDAATIQRVIDAVLQHGSGVAALPVTDTIKEAEADGFVVQTPERSRLYAMQTPQGFRLNDLLEAAELAEKEGYLGTDDASLLEYAEMPVFLCEGSRNNLKITHPEDMKMAEKILGSLETEGAQNGKACDADRLSPYRIGQGYDVHQLVPERKLVLCGVEVPWEKGLLGHSDADVALHALMDAMLGAAALGDIGKHFPDTDPAYKGISSMVLLGHVNKLLLEKHLRVSNADVTIVAQKPKLLPFIPQMKQNVAEALNLPPDRVNIKATTTEHLGFEGRMEGISAQAVCLLSENC